MGLDDPALPRDRRGAARAAARGRPRRRLARASCASAAGRRSTSARGPTPHAEGKFVTPTGKLGLRADWLADAGVDTLPFFDPPAEAAGERGGRFPLALVTPKTHLFLNSTFANQERQHSAQPEPYVVVNPDDAAGRGVDDGAMVRVFNDRGSFRCRATVSDDARPGVVVAPMGWWSGRLRRRVGGQATTSQRLTALGDAPTFNDNRVELEPA